MPRKSIEPLKKITVDLFLADVVWLQANSDNLTEAIRTAVCERVLFLKQNGVAVNKPMTLGDLNAR